MAISALTGAALFLLYLWLRSEGFELAAGGLIACGISVAVFLAGLIELATNRPISELADGWEDLEGWQRGLFGTVIVIVFIALLMTGIVVVLVNIA
jgi:hypothetical protein